MAPADHWVGARVRLAGLALVAVLIAAGAGVGSAQAAFGDLTFANCVTASFTTPLCGGDQDPAGFFAPQRSLVIAPGGTSAYSANRAGSLISQYDRDPTTGKLTYKTCWQDTGGECSHIAAGLGGVTGLAISPDGGSLYAAGSSDGALVYFSRDASTGDLTNLGCVEDEDNIGGSGCGTTAKALDGAYAVTVSPDNSSIYVAGSGDRAVAHFDRDSNQASLFFGIPVQDASDPCDDSAPGIENGCVHSVPLLSQPTEIAVTPNGANVYVADPVSSEVVAFDRATSGDRGDLSYDSCVEDGTATSCGGASASSLHGVDSITLGPGGSSLYAASMHGDGLIPFTILPGGSLERTGPCFSDADAPAEGCTRIEGLGQGLNSGPTGPHAVGVTPDGRSAYVASGDSIVDSDHALSEFDRDPSTGALSYRGCIRDTTDGIPGCATSFDLLSDVNGVVAASDSLVYAVGGDHSITTFNRDLSAPPPAGQAPTQPSPQPIARKKCKKHKRHKRAAESKKKHKKKCKRKRRKK
jgi:DNA-binding beta-propeller fold protein YncE